MMRIYTYILLLNTGTHYTGITKDIERRLNEHSRGESKSTKNGRPVKLIWINESKTREKARYLEVKIKRSGARRFMKTYPFGNHGQLLIKPLNNMLASTKFSIYNTVKIQSEL